MKLQSAIIRKVSLLATALLMMLLTGLTVAQGQQLSGKGEWRSVSSDLISGTWTATLVRDGGRLRGSLQLTGSNVLPGGEVSGEIDPSSIVLGVMTDNTRQAIFSAKLAGDVIEGEWQCDAVKDHGVWFGTLSAAKPASTAAQE